MKNLGNSTNRHGLALLAVLWLAMTAGIPTYARDFEVEKIPDNKFIATRSAYGHVFDSHEWFLNHSYFDIDLQLGSETYNCHDDLFAHLYGYPRYGFGLSYGTFSNIHMNGSYLKDIFSLYGFFDRDIIRTGKFSMGYILEAGLGASAGLYDRFNNPDNIFLSSPVFFYIAGGFKINAHLGPNWSIGASVRLKHHSNGRLSLPNQGINMIETGIEARYIFDESAKDKKWIDYEWRGGNGYHDGDILYHEITDNQESYRWSEEMYKLKRINGFDIHLSISGGLHSYKAEWEAYNERVENPGQKMEKFKLYPRGAFNIEASYRYATRFSTGLSCGLYYYGGIDALKNAEKAIYGPTKIAEGPGYGHFVLGLGIIQEFYYKNLALYAELGIYPYKKLGVSHVIGWNYQKGGLRYYIPKAGNMFIGFAVKAIDFRESEYMELSLGFKLGPLCSKN